MLKMTETQEIILNALGELCKKYPQQRLGQNNLQLHLNSLSKSRPILCRRWAITLDNRKRNCKKYLKKVLTFKNDYAIMNAYEGQF